MKKYRSENAEKNLMHTYDQLLKEWGVQVEELDIATQFGLTHVVTAGENASVPLILFHGVGDDSALMWIYNAKELAKYYKIYAIDTIGGPGKSMMGEGYNKNFDDIVWIEDIMKSLNVKKASFVGVSHGGYLVQLFSLRRSEKVEKAISISSSVPSGKKNGTIKTMLKIFFPEALFPTRSNTVKLIEKLSGTNAEVFTKNPLIMEHYHWLLKGFNNMAMRYHKVLPFSEDEIRTIKDKVFYLVGEQDLFEKMGGKNDLLEYDMNVRFYANSGHGLNHENADEINQIMIDIIDERIYDIRNG